MSNPVAVTLTFPVDQVDSEEARLGQADTPLDASGGYSVPFQEPLTV
ncbi:hypothetical protein ACS5PJ_02320 [Pseudarthrobacter sp. YS3]